jgi:hypothetical protein
MRKNIITKLVIFILCLLYASPVLAASGLSEAEVSILDKLHEKFIIGGMEVQIPTSYLNQAENELIKNNVDITPEQAEIIIAKVDEALQIAKTINIRTISDFEQSEAVEKIVVLVKEAASAANYTISVDIFSGSVDIVDPDGNSMYLVKEVINQTGYDLSQSIGVGILLLSMLTACVVVGCKYKLFTSIGY